WDGACNIKIPGVRSTSPLGLYVLSRFGQDCLKRQILGGGLMEIHAGAFILAVQAAQIEVVDAAEIAVEVEGVALDFSQPTCQGLQVQSILAHIVALNDTHCDFRSRVS